MGNQPARERGHVSFITETVIVQQRTPSGVNEIGETIWVDERQDVAGVLVAPGNGVDVSDTIRPDGSRVTYTLYFPKTFTGTLRGAKVVVRGIELDVIGEPDRYVGAPGKWDMVVQVGVVHG